MSYDIWNIVFSGLTAIGTIGACAISLALACEKYKQKIDCVFIWGAPNDYKPTLLINNLCERTIVIRTIDVFYGHKHVALFDYLEDFALGKCATIPAKSENCMLLDADKFKFEDLKISGDGEKNHKKLLKIVVTTSSNKKFVSKQKYYTNEIFDLLFSNGLLNDN